jgi:enoyl-CoA hydratase/carnithine racemase
LNSFEFVLYEKREHIAYVTINRPDVMNALHGPAGAEMGRVWADFRDDPDSWVAIVTGAGDRAFSAGMDLRARAAANAATAAGEAPPPSTPLPNTGANPGFGGLTNPRNNNIWKPIIAAVNGYALGGGLELAMACDIIIAADHAQLGLPEPKRGIIAGAGGVHRLPRQIPLKIAMGYMLTGRHMSAQDAHRWGLVNEVVPLAELIPTAERWAREIMECAPLSVQATKQSAMQGLELSLEQAYNGSYEAVQRMMASEDSKEGPRAFAERRKPVWTGR